MKKILYRGRKNGKKANIRKVLMLINFLLVIFDPSHMYILCISLDKSFGYLKILEVSIASYFLSFYCTATNLYTTWKLIFSTFKYEASD